MADLHYRFEKDAIRPARAEDAEAIATINVACWRSAYRDIIDPAILAGHSVTESAGRWRRYLSARNSTILVAEENGQVLGFGSGCPQRDPHLAAIGYSGEISTLYVLPQEQGRGIGSRIMASLARNLVHTGHTSASVWVLERNGLGRRFYESLKGRLLPLRHELPRLGNAAEVAYAWPVLRTLCSRGLHLPLASSNP